MFESWIKSPSHFVMLFWLAGISGAASTDQSSRRGEAQGATSDAT